MRVQFMGAEQKDYETKDGKRGTEYAVQVHDGKGVRTIRVQNDFFRRVEKIAPFTPVQVHFGFVEGNFGRHYAAVVDIVPEKAG